MSDAPAGLLLFRLSGRRIAIEVGLVAEVSELPQIWPIPLAPPCFAGVMNFHGALIPLLDLSQLLKAGKGAPHGAVMVLDRKLCDLALWVDGVERTGGRDAKTSDRIPEEPFIKSIVNLRGEEVPLLDATRLLESLEADLHGANHNAISVPPV